MLLSNPPPPWLMVPRWSAVLKFIDDLRKCDGLKFYFEVLNSVIKAPFGIYNELLMFGSFPAVWNFALTGLASGETTRD